MTYRANARKEAALLPPGRCERQYPCPERMIELTPKGRLRWPEQRRKPAEAQSAEARKGLLPHVGVLPNKMKIMGENTPGTVKS